MNIKKLQTINKKPFVILTELEIVRILFSIIGHMQQKEQRISPPIIAGYFLFLVVVLVSFLMDGGPLQCTHL